MSADSSSHSCDREPSQEEDDKLFLATGFRYRHAFERGFPHPWCAKFSKKGWIVRDSPPLSCLRRDMGVEFVGWRAADKMFRSRELLLERVRNQQRNYSEQSQAIPPEGPPVDARVTSDVIARSAKMKSDIDHWFRHTASAVKSQESVQAEEAFSAFVLQARKRVRKQHASVMKQERQRKREERKRRKINDVQAKDEITSSTIAEQTPVACPSSPSRRKHKKIIPRRNQHASNSIILGEDPELDEMIGDIVKECTEASADAGGSSLEFDGSAVSALREAARETLMAQQAMSTNIAKHQKGRSDRKRGAPHKSTAPPASSPPTPLTIVVPLKLDVPLDVHRHPPQVVPVHREVHVRRPRRVPPVHVHAPIHNNQQQQHNKDERIANMIAQLIGDVEKDSGCQFDEPAVEALKEAAKEIFTNEDNAGNGAQKKK